MNSTTAPGGPGSNQHQRKPKRQPSEPTATGTPVPVDDDPLDVDATEPVDGIRGKWGWFSSRISPDLTCDQADSNNPAEVGDDTYEWYDPDHGGVVGRVVIDDPDPDASTIVVRTVEVHPELRGLGWSKPMLSKVAADYPDALLVVDEFTGTGQRRLAGYLPNVAAEYDGVEDMLVDDGADPDDPEFADARVDALDEWWDRAKAEQDRTLRNG